MQLLIAYFQRQACYSLELLEHKKLTINLMAYGKQRPQGNEDPTGMHRIRDQ